jgi:hypothetical protein
MKRLTPSLENETLNPKPQNPNNYFHEIFFIFFNWTNELVVGFRTQLTIKR